MGPGNEMCENDASLRNQSVGMNGNVLWIQVVECHAPPMKVLDGLIILTPPHLNNRALQYASKKEHLSAMRIRKRIFLINLPVQKFDPCIHGIVGVAI